MLARSIFSVKTCAQQNYLYGSINAFTAQIAPFVRYRSNLYVQTLTQFRDRYTLHVMEMVASNVLKRARKIKEESA